MEAQATAKYIRISPNKARRAVDLIRGKHVDEARRILRFSVIGAAEPVGKVLNSAIANAETKPGAQPGMAKFLFVTRAYVDEGPTLRRFRPRAQGRATRIRKRTSHITLHVETIGAPDGS